MSASKLFTIICLAVFCALELHDCNGPAHAGVTDDAAAVRRSTEHIERMLDRYGRIHFGEQVP